MYYIFQEVISTPYIFFTKAKACDWLVTRKYFLSPVSIISIRFTSISYYVMMTCACPGAIGQACHTLHSTCRLWSKILRLRGDHLGWEVWGSFGWTMLVWHSTSFGCSTQIQKKKKVLVWYLLLYLGSSKVIRVWEIYYSSKIWVRALYDPSPWI